MVNVLRTGFGYNCTLDSVSSKSLIVKVVSLTVRLKEQLAVFPLLSVATKDIV